MSMHTITNVILLPLLFFLRFGTTLQSDPLSIRAEKAALFTLRSSLGLRTKEWPIKSDPCSTWVGIQCENGSVIGINISGFKRTTIGNQNPAFAVDSLVGFTNLVSFNASRFLLIGSIPDWLGVRVKTLKFLDLRFCGISGGIPGSIGNLTGLIELYLSGNVLTGGIPDSLGMLLSLSVLDLSRNVLTGLIPLSFGNLVNLHCLNLSSNGLSSNVPAQIGKLDSLVVLDLSFNAFSGLLPKELGSLRSLRRIVIRDNNFSGELPDAIWSLPGLSFLDVSDNNFVGSLPNKSLNGNVTKSVFNLSHNMFYGVLTCVLRRVSFIDLSYNYFQGNIPDYVHDAAFLDGNCFRNWPSQRGLKECAAFYSMKGLLFDTFGLTDGSLSSVLHDHKSKRRVLVFAAVFGSLGLILFLVISVILLILFRYKNRKTTQAGNDEGPLTTERESVNLMGLGELFTYEKIVSATNDFNDANFIKNGHSGDIFKGVLEGGTHIIVKRVDVHSGKIISALELDLYSKISHPRLIPLLGHCLENEKEKFLIYKYMPKGDLSSSLYTKNCSDDDTLKSLDWITRLKIAIGAAEGLSYLHHECSPPVVHRDIEASSILLDDKYEVRLGSLSEACTHEGDNYSNRITRLLRSPQTSEQSASGVITGMCSYDVYCFGKVLLELVTGRIGISASRDLITKDILEGILPYISLEDKDLMTNIMDPSLVVDEDLLEEVWAMAVIAKSCLDPKPSKRPLMRFILKALENLSKVVREDSTSSEKLPVKSSKSSWGGSSSSSCNSLPYQTAGSQLPGNVDGCLSTR
uniref:probable LRR receptor-like serine/threonine-protein kinase At2g16250 n=1 Tax=Erigeron canadensis TaxID=72917 RepID=UPI001CB8C8E9|nr:probable LRR receptor-like serine/threonine-protein kinase At2g16250 [Erigeron canadensis]